MSQDLTVQLVNHRGVPVMVMKGDLDVHAARQMHLVRRELVDAALGALLAPPAPTGRPHESWPGGHPDAADGDQERQELEQDPARGDRRVVVLDLCGGPFADSAGVGSIIGVLRRALE